VTLARFRCFEALGGSSFEIMAQGGLKGIQVDSPEIAVASEPTVETVKPAWIEAVYPPLGDGLDTNEMGLAERF
jgi:hypothetical protein